jgi:hypothetical protein
MRSRRAAFRPPVSLVSTLEFSRSKFLAALAIGRGIRYTLLAFLAERYGRQILRRMVEYRQPILLFGIAAGVAASLYVLVRYNRGKRPSHQT